MGYGLYIGNAKLESDPDNLEAWWCVEGETHPDAPIGSSGFRQFERQNSCLPSYTNWAMFSSAVGLYDLFFADGGMMIDHPGIAPLRQQHLEAFESARERWMLKPIEERLKICGSSNTIDWHLRRLDWLCWWTRYSLANHERPAFSNG